MSADVVRHPLVTIGLATYNRPGGLEAALISLRSQTYKNLRIVVSDNASSEARTSQILEHYSRIDTRVEVFRQPHNIGQIGNFRFLFGQSRTEYFMWAADDDEWEPTFVEVCLDNLERSSGIVLAFCRVRKRDPVSGRIVAECHDDDVGCSGASVVRRSARYLLRSATNECFYGLYRSAAISDWFFRRSFGNDHIAVLSVLRFGAISIAPEVLFTSSTGGLGSGRERYHEYYDSMWKKASVTLNSTVTWFCEFEWYVWTADGYSVGERIALSSLVVARFLQFRFIRRFLGDVVALVTKPRIWDFLRRAGHG